MEPAAARRGIPGARGRGEAHRQAAHPHRGAAASRTCRATRSWRAAGAVIGKIDIDIAQHLRRKRSRARTRVFTSSPTGCTSAPSAATHPRPAALQERGPLQRRASSPKPSAICAMLVYIYDARVVPVRYADGKVDIQVITQDVWTLDPNISFGRVRRHQLHQLPACKRRISWAGARRCRSDAPATSIAPATTAAYFGSRTCSDRAGPARSGLRRFERRRQRVAAALPAFLFARYAPGARSSRGKAFDRTISRYFLGDIVDQFNDNERSYLIRGGLSSGLIDGWTKRLTFGMYYDRNDIPADPGDEPAGQAAAAAADAVLSLRGLRHRPGQIRQDGR